MQILYVMNIKKLKLYHLRLSQQNFLLLFLYKNYTFKKIYIIQA